MDAGTARGDERGRRLLLVTLGMGFFVLALLAWPSQARAQTQCDQPGCRPLCVSGEDAAAKENIPLYTLTAAKQGDGEFAVTARNPYAGASYNSPANKERECATRQGDTDVWDVKHFCTFHCEHRHYFVNPGGRPQPATARVTPTATVGSFFLGWTPESNCSPPASTSFHRNVCAILVNDHKTVTADFGLGEDTQAPTAPAIAVTARQAFKVSFSLTPATDDRWLGGYEVFLDDVLRTRVGPAATAFTIANLFCQKAYSFRVDAFDSSNETGSNVVNATTTKCPKVPPNGVFHVKPAKRTKAKQAFFHWGARRGGADLPQRSFKSKCRVDKKRWHRCSSVNGKTVRKLKPGWHTFRVRVGDAQGWDKTPAVWRWRVRR